MLTEARLDVADRTFAKNDLDAGGSAARPGALVVSLDFELMWGVRDTLGVDGRYLPNLRSTHDVVPRILDLFAEFDVAGTWATVGALFAEGFDELVEYMPAELPTYENPNLSPYQDLKSESAAHPKVYFAPELVREVASRPKQELASHTFSHFYCLEAGQTMEQFEADMRAAVSIARDHGYELNSLVFPRNQVNPRYFPSLERLGFTSYRGTEGHPLARPHAAAGETLLLRGTRLLDSMVNITGHGGVSWSTTKANSALTDVRSSRFLRPVMKPSFLASMMINRVERGLERAARAGKIYHLWWHPHNFGANTEENLDGLRRLLTVFSRCRDEWGTESLTMRDVAKAVAVEGAGEVFQPAV